ncbi:MAG: response regulator [Armatimonadetes bacterium]|nr:response regulator [Anaerolineae bacterium]
MTQLHALIIDDNAMNLTVMSNLLNAMQIAYTTVQDETNVPRVLATLERLDLVFLDLALPNADGYQILDLLQNTYGITVPIVACTVYANEINTARQQGFHSFLTKPLDPVRFQRSVQQILNNQPVWETD